MLNFTPSKLCILITLLEFICSIYWAYNHNIPWLFLSVFFTLIGGFMSIVFTKEKL